MQTDLNEVSRLTALRQHPEVAKALRDIRDTYAAACVSAFYEQDTDALLAAATTAAAAQTDREAGLAMSYDESVILRAVAAMDATDCAMIQDSSTARRDDLTRNSIAGRLIERLRSLAGDLTDEEGRRDGYANGFELFQALLKYYPDLGRGSPVTVVYFGLILDVVEMPRG